MRSRRLAARAAAAALLAALGALVGCGPDYEPRGGPEPPGAAPPPLAARYDLLATVPGLVMPPLSATGLTLDLALAIDPPGLSSSGTFSGTVEVQSALAGGLPRSFAPAPPAAPLPASGFVSGSDWRLDSFGPIQIGDPATGLVFVTIAFDGLLAADGRTLTGRATVTSSGETGSFDGVKQRRYLVAGTDFGVTGTVSLITVRYATLPARRAIQVERDLEAVSGDPVVRSTGGDALVVNRFFFDNLQVLDAAAGFATALQFSTGNGSNPHDAVAVDAGRLYISRYEPPWNDLLIADRASGAPLSRVDLSPAATNRSGTPRADGMALAEGRLFVGLQNIDSSFTEYGPGRVAIIDPGADRLDRTLTLSGKNPFGPPAVHPVTGDLFWALAGVFRGGLPQELSGGVEVIDPRTLTALGLRVDDDALGGNVSSVALSEALPAGGGGGQPPVIGYCVVTTPSGTNLVRTFDPDSGAVAAGVAWQSATLLPEVVADGDGWILIPEHDITTPRLLILEAATGALIAAPPLSLPPFSVAVLTQRLGGS